MPAEIGRNPGVGKKLDEGSYERLVQSVVDYAIYMLDPQGRIVSWNAGAERIKGYSAAEIIGEHFSRFYPAEDREAAIPQKALSVAAEAGRFTTEGWRLRKDGSRFWAMVVIDPIRQDGKLVGFAKITRDITEQRQAVLAAIESEQRFRLLVQGVTDYAIYMLTPEGMMSNWNAGAERIKGYKAAEIVGHPFLGSTRPKTRGDIPFMALETARGKGRYVAEGWRVRKDGGRFWASAVIDAIHDEEGPLIGFAKVTRDLTDVAKRSWNWRNLANNFSRRRKWKLWVNLPGSRSRFQQSSDRHQRQSGIVANPYRAGPIERLDRYITGAQFGRRVRRL